MHIKLSFVKIARADFNIFSCVISIILQHPVNSGGVQDSFAKYCNVVCVLNKYTTVLVCEP